MENKHILDGFSKKKPRNFDAYHKKINSLYERFKDQFAKE